MKIIKFKGWTFLVDHERTKKVYESVKYGGADTCECANCKNYVLYRTHVFPDDIKTLLKELGIEHNKEVEITTWETLRDGSLHIGGWFHCIGKILEGHLYKTPLPYGGYTYSLTKVASNFSIGFDSGNDLTYFDPKERLIQIEFDTTIPWLLTNSPNLNS